jgi:Phosphotransferase enzyme family
MTIRFATPTDPHVMRQCLDPLILAAIDDRLRVSEIRWDPFELATSYDAHVATVNFDNGATRRVFAKNFGSTVRPKDSPKQRREREVQVYRDLLEGAGLGTARYYGSVLDDPQGQLWLLLEFVAGTPVGYCDIATSWAPAAAALGRLHGHFAPHVCALDGCDFLVHHTHEFFWSKVELASRCVTAIAPERTKELSAIVKRYAPIVDLLAEQPRTLIHGGCRSTNILINIDAEPSRVCIIDWEEAACGAPLCDLAYLLDGIERPQLDPLLEAYQHEALTHGISLPNPRDMKHVIDCFRLHMIMVMLSQAVLKGYTPQSVEKLLAIADRLAVVVSRSVG